jgi:6-phosphogluconolactonase
MRFLLPLLTLSALQASAMDLTYYIGTAGPQAPGILLGHLDSETGQLSEPVLVAPAKGASYQALSRDGKFLYTTVEADGGGVAAYRVEGTKLVLLNKETTKGQGATHLALDATGRNLLVANYGSGSVACLPVKADGSLEPVTSFDQHQGTGPNASRQAGPHAHGIYPDAKNRYVYVPDLGTDDVFIYKLEAEQHQLVLQNPKSGRVPAGAGPRHLSFSPNGKLLYVCNEMGLTVTVFAVNETNGQLKELQTISTMPAGTEGIKGTTVAEIFGDAQGRFLYVSNRGHDSIVVFAIGQDGTLAPAQFMLKVPSVPRGFGLSPDGKWLVCAGQKSGTVNAYKIDAKTGQLTDTHQAVSAPGGAAILFNR